MLGLRIEIQDNHKLQAHHHGEEKKWKAARGAGPKRESAGDERVHDPVSGAAEALAFGAHARGKNFAEINPDHGALRNGEKADVSQQKPQKIILVAIGEEDCGNARKAKCCSDGADKKQSFASDFVDEAHSEEGGDQIHGANRDGLEFTGDFAEASRGENVVQIVENCVDAGQLIEHAKSDGEKNRVAVFVSEDGLCGLQFFEVDGFDDFGEFGVRLRGTGHLQDAASFVEAAFGHKPARAAGNSKKQEEEEKSGGAGDAKLPAPLVVA